MLLEINVSEDKRHSDCSVKRGTATGKRRVLEGVLFAQEGIEKPEDNTTIRTGRQIKTGGLPGCGFGSTND